MIVIGAVSAAFAHAHLVASSPAAESSGSPPTEISLRFSEKLEGAFNAIVVRNAAGEQVDKRNVQLDKTDRMTLRVSLPALQAGIYTVEWHAVSTDSHRVQGSFSFRVKE
ncbi:MAG TPA: copper homeostasis periplasmic binding protein CopC [Pseudolabrys sp.]|nr:copper homeostasis periplasmic binding protein CopC [Pseudolabrys sp.]